MYQGDAETACRQGGARTSCKALICRRLYFTQRELVLVVGRTAGIAAFSIQISRIVVPKGLAPAASKLGSGIIVYLKILLNLSLLNDSDHGKRIYRPF